MRRSTSAQAFRLVPLIALVLLGVTLCTLSRARADSSTWEIRSRPVAVLSVRDKHGKVGRYQARLTVKGPREKSISSTIGSGSEFTDLVAPDSKMGSNGRYYGLLTSHSSRLHVEAFHFSI